MHNAVGVDLGDGDDRLASSAALEAYGRACADELAASGEPAVAFHGGDGPDRLTGGDGDDRLYGDGGGDALAGGDGDDTLAGDAHDATIPVLAPGGLAGPSDDTLDGGPGADRVLYSRRPRTVVTVDLRAGTGGQPGERDTLTSVEGATGNDEDDVLLGDAGDNTLVSGNGADVVYGGPGDDTLDSYGAARLFGGEGDDFVRAGPTAFRSSSSSRSAATASATSPRARRAPRRRRSRRSRSRRRARSSASRACRSPTPRPAGSR
jgi:Ca2+-binding RTX toxin-like protein